MGTGVEVRSQDMRGTLKKDGERVGLHRKTEGREAVAEGLDWSYA